MSLACTNPPLVSMIVATENGRELPRHDLLRLLPSTFRIFVAMVADDRSVDGTSEMLRKPFPAVRLREVMNREHKSALRRSDRATSPAGRGRHCREFLPDCKQKAVSEALALSRAALFFEDQDRLDDFAGWSGEGSA